MSENPPRNESGPNSPAEAAPTPSLEETGERNAVPPTPEAPAQAIAERRERLARTAVEATPNQAPAQPAVAATVPVAPTRGPFGKIIHGTGRVMGKGFKMGAGFLHGFFGYIFVHMIWHGLKNLPSFGGGGGGSKPSGGGGGGHH